MGMNTCNPNSWARGPEVTGSPGLHSKFSKIEYGICVLVSKAKQIPLPPPKKKTKILQGMIAPQPRPQKTGQRTTIKKLSLGHDLGLLISQIQSPRPLAAAPHIGSL